MDSEGPAKTRMAGTLITMLTLLGLAVVAVLILLGVAGFTISTLLCGITLLFGFRGMLAGTAVYVYAGASFPELSRDCAPRPEKISAKSGLSPSPRPWGRVGSAVVKPRIAVIWANIPASGFLPRFFRHRKT